jgi:hypothetical protein
MKWVGHVTCMEEKRNAYRALMKNPEEERPIVTPKHSWEGNIKMGG